jgi:signal peptidase II
VNKKIAGFLLALILSVGADQATKAWARHSLKPKYPETVKIIPGYFELRYSENPGASFGLLRGVPGAKYIFFVVGGVALFVVGGYLKKARPEQLRLGAELGLLAGGAIGNVIDRAWLGKVTDFIVWKAGSHEWPTFNIADAALVIGIIGLLFDLKPPDSAAKKKAA